MKDYKLSEIKELCIKFRKEYCSHCPFEKLLNCEDTSKCPSTWDIENSNNSDQFEPLPMKEDKTEALF